MKHYREKSFSLVAFIFLLSSITITAAAQLDSLPRLLSKTEQDLSSEECALLCESISAAYSQKDMSHPALYWIDRAITLSSDSLVLSRFHRKKARILSRLQHYTQVLEATQLARKLGGKKIPPSELYAIYSSEASVFTYTGRYEESFRKNYKALLIASSNNDQVGIRYSTSNLGLVYYKVKDYRMAIDYYTKSLEGFPKEGVEFPLVMSNLALAYAFANLPENALSCLRQIQKEKLTGLHAIQYFYAYGMFSQLTQQLDSARAYYSKSLQLSIHQNNHRYIAENYLVIAQIGINRSDTIGVWEYLSIAEQHALENNFEDIILRISEQRAKLAERRGNIRQLIPLQNKFIRKQIELYNTSLSQFLARRKSQHFEREYRVAMKRQNYLLQANQESERAQNIFNYIFCCLFALTGTLLVLVFVSIRTRKRHRLNLEIVVINRSHFITKRVEDLGSFVAQFHSSVYSARRVLIRAIDHRSIKVRQKIHARNTL